MKKSMSNNTHGKILIYIYILQAQIKNLIQTHEINNLPNMPDSTKIISRGLK